MRALTTAERRGVLLVAGLFLLGAAYDAWRSTRPLTEVRDAPSSTAGTSRAKPAQGDLTQGTNPGVAPRAPRREAAPEGPLDLNRAEVADLEALDGIGPTLAQRIVEHRNKHGPFQSVDELRAVRGIGPRLIERIRARVAVGPRAG